MPIYEFRCKDCSERFEELVRGPGSPVACAGCGSGQVERLLSSFAGVGSRSSAMPVHSRVGRAESGGCCGGGCGHAH